LTLKSFIIRSYKNRGAPPPQPNNPRRQIARCRIAWSDVWLGATLTSILFTAGKFLIGFYIGKSVTLSAYGAAGSVVIILAWIYYSAQLLYFGAEFTHVYSRMRLAMQPESGT
jgi:uncharacterized BrkB/YihY/UPF0761 family membrane protein